MICCANNWTGLYMRATLAFNGLYKLRERLLVEIRDTKYYNERYLFTAKCIASLSYLFNKYRYKIMTFSDSYNAFEVF